MLVAAIRETQGGSAYGAVRQDYDTNGGRFVGLHHETDQSTSVNGNVDLPANAGIRLNGTEFAGGRNDLFAALFNADVVVSTDTFLSLYVPQKVHSYGSAKTGGGPVFGYLEAEGMTPKARAKAEVWMAQKAGIQIE